MSVVTREGSPTLAERHEAGRALREHVPRAGHARVRGRHRPGPTLSVSSRTRPENVCPTSFPFGTAGWLHRPFAFLRGSAAVTWRTIWRPRRAPGSTSRRAGMPIWPTSAPSPRLSGTWSSTSTTSTRRLQVPGNGSQAPRRQLRRRRPPSRIPPRTEAPGRGGCRRCLREAGCGRWPRWDSSRRGTPASTSTRSSLACAELQYKNALAVS
jgi:hypothetical protein